MSRVARNLAAFLEFILNALLRDEPVPDQRAYWTDGTD